MAKRKKKNRSASSGGGVTIQLSVHVGDHMLPARMEESDQPKKRGGSSLADYALDQLTNSKGMR